MEKTLELVTKEKYFSFFASDSFCDDDYTNNAIGNTYARGNTLIKHFKDFSGDEKGKVFCFVFLQGPWQIAKANLFS